MMKKLNKGGEQKEVNEEDDIFQNVADANAVADDDEDVIF